MPGRVAREGPQPRNRFAEIAHDVVKAAADGLTKEAFAERLAIQMGGQPYHRNTVGPWLSGRVAPPADVVLAAASMAGIDLTERLGERSILQRLERLEAAQRELLEKQRYFDVIRGRLTALLGDNDSSSTPYGS